MQNENRLEHLSWPSIKAKIEQGYDTVLICTASIEQHGPHLSEYTDTCIGVALSDIIAQKMGNTLIAPIIRPGLSGHHAKMPGTLSLRPEIYKGIIEDYVTCYQRCGFKKFVLISSHGGNLETNLQLTDTFKARYPELIFSCPVTIETLVKVMHQMSEEYDLGKGVSGHAGAFETAIMLYIAPEQVDMSRAEPGFTAPLTAQVARDLWDKGICALSENGILGDPTSGVTSQMGKKYLHLTAEVIADAAVKQLDH